MKDNYQVYFSEIYVKLVDCSDQDLLINLISYHYFYNSFIEFILNQNDESHELPSLDYIKKIYGEIGTGGMLDIIIDKANDDVDHYIDLTLLRKHKEADSCFISYSRGDELFANKLYEALQEFNIKCWFDRANLKGGKILEEQIRKGINSHNRLLLVLSENSIESNWVKTEISEAINKQKNKNRQMLYPIRLVDYEVLKNWKLYDSDLGTDLAAEVRKYFIPDFSNWEDEESFQSNLNRLVESLKRDT